MKVDAGGRELFSGFHFGMDDWGIWRLPVAERRDDNSPAIYGWVMRPSNIKVPRGTAENVVAVRKHLSSLTGLWKFADHESQP